MKLIFTFAESKKGAIYIASESGLFVYNYVTDSLSAFLNNPKNNKSISNNNVRALYFDQQDNLWIGTFGGGLNYYDSKKQHFISYTTENGLLDNTIYSICPDLKNNLWLGTNKGLCCFNTHSKTSTYLTIKDGIQNYEFNTNASLSLKSGLLFIGGIRGINAFFPDSIKTPVVNNRIIVSKFLINDEEQVVNDSSIELAYNQNYLVIHFAGLGYYRNSEYNYAYQLVGLDTTWNYCGYQRQVNYTNLAPGKYVFKVKVSDCYGNWTYSTKLLSFKINRPWFKTWWFYVIIITILSLLIFWMIQFRFQQILALQNIRNDIARDLHDEVGSNLSNISLFNAVASEKAKNISDVLPILNKISEYTQLSQEAMSDIVWMINSDNDSLENLTTKIRNYTDTVIENTAIVATFQITPEANKIALSMLQRKNIFLLFKEALNNSIKHSKCSEIFIALEIENNFLVLRFKDNGIGFDTAAVKTGNGLLNFKKRINELKGKLEMVTVPKNGVLLTFKIPAR
jgi:two-component sensor histidine kinase